MNAAPPQPLRILLTEDHASTRMGIRQILKEHFCRVQLGEAGTAAETITLLRQQSWHMLILDISLPDCHGLELLTKVRQQWPALPVLIYSAHPEDQFATHALRAQAAGYLTKERAPEELVLAVQTVLGGRKYMSASLASRLANSLATDRTDLPHGTLSEREFQVFRHTAVGRTGKEIAAELGISQKTVSTYRTRILRKLRFHSMADLIQYAVRHGLV